MKNYLSKSFSDFLVKIFPNFELKSKISNNNFSEIFNFFVQNNRDRLPRRWKELAKNLQKWATISALIGGCFSVILNSYLIPLYGIDGVLISAVLAQVISLGSLFFLTKEARVMIVYFLSALNFVRLFIFVSRTLKRKLFYYG